MSGRTIGSGPTHDVSVVVYVGSLRPAKVDAVRAALASIAAVDERFRDADVRPRDVGHVAPRMPLTEAEVLEGARQRAVRPHGGN